MLKKILLIAGIFLACSGGPEPKDTVFAFIEAVMVSDSLGVIDALDVDAYVESRMTEMTLEDSAATLELERKKTINSLLNDGPTRLRWMTQQIIVNEAKVYDDTAEVEVSFIDKTTRHMIYTKMQLVRQADGSWKITYFR
jgi:hypothetical protein